TNGTARDRAYSFALPNGTNAVGNLQFTVTADTFNNLFEYNSSGSGESNNSGSITRASSLAVYPDLLVNNLTVTPATLQSGTNIVVNWADANSGNGATAGSFHDRLVIRNLTTDETLLSTTLFYDEGASGNGPISTGQSRSRQFPFRRSEERRVGKEWRSGVTPSA